jgi:hypothetical protein
MRKRPHPPDGSGHPRNGGARWSIGSNGLTAAGQAEVMKQIGRQLQADYQEILKEPPPARLRTLLKRLNERSDPDDE